MAETSDVYILNSTGEIDPTFKTVVQHAPRQRAIRIQSTQYKFITSNDN